MGARPVFVKLDADATWGVAFARQRRADLARTEENYRQALMVDPACAQAYLRLGMLYEARADRLAEDQWLVAADWYEKYHRLAPDDLMVLQRLTGICADLDDTATRNRSCQEAAGSVSLALSRRRKA